MEKNFIRLWAEDFDQDIWTEYCDACNVPYDATHITVYFEDKDIKYDDMNK